MNSDYPQLRYQWMAFVVIMTAYGVIASLSLVGLQSLRDIGLKPSNMEVCIQAGGSWTSVSCDHRFTDPNMGSCTLLKVKNE